MREEHMKGYAYVRVTSDRKTVRLVLVLLITRLEALVHKSRVVEKVGRSGMEHLKLGDDLLFGATASAQGRLVAVEYRGEMYLDVSRKRVILTHPFSLPDSGTRGVIGRKLSLADVGEVDFLPDVDYSRLVCVFVRRSRTDEEETQLGKPHTAKSRKRKDSRQRKGMDTCEGSGGEAEDSESEALGDGCELHVDGCQVWIDGRFEVEGGCGEKKRLKSEDLLL
jgi:hypothetical protein